MPICRKKVCDRCRAAKARCNLGNPRCSRCAERGFDCRYAGSTGRWSPYSASTDFSQGAVSGSGAAQTERAVEQASRARQGVAECHGPILDLSSTDSTSMTPWSFSQLEAGCSVAPTPPLDPLGQMLSLSCGLDPTYGRDGQMSLAGLPNTPPDLNILAPYCNPASLLTKRRPLALQDMLTSKIMRGHVESYPKMLIQGLTLPPFIHSRCLSNDAVMNDCFAKRTHQCLPRILSVCATLVQLFFSRTRQSSDFVWSTIYAEQAKLHREHKGYDEETLLQALQATCIYVILQMLDMDTTVKNDVDSLVITLGDMAKRLHTISKYQKDEDLSTARNFRHRWILRESTRRTIAFLYVIEVLVDVMFGERDLLSCVGFTETPIPCVRGLWENESTSNWVQEYHSALSRRMLSRPLMVKDLEANVIKALSSTLSHHELGTDNILADVASWCEHLDQFGTLVWMASTVSMAA